MKSYQILKNLPPFFDLKHKNISHIDLIFSFSDLGISTLINKGIIKLILRKYYTPYNYQPKEVKTCKITQNAIFGHACLKTCDNLKGYDSEENWIKCSCVDAALGLTK